MQQGKAVLKGFFARQPAKADWPADPEEACIKHASFLKLWCPMGFSKPQSREAWKGAFPKMAAGDINAMLQGTAEARKWLGRKWRNLKTGDRTHPIIKDLLHSLNNEQGTNNVNSPKGRPSTSSPKGRPSLDQPGKPESSLRDEPETAAEESQSSSLRRLNTKTSRCPILVAEAEPAMAVMDVEVVSVTSTALTASSKGVLSAGVLKKPATAAKKAAKAKAANSKKAAEAKEPAKGKKVLKSPGSLKKVWHETVSHGLVKVTRASEKAYITYKASDGKEKSLVNVHVKKGDRQARIMAILLEKLQTEEVDKETLVKYKTWLLGRELDAQPAEAEEGEPAMADEAEVLEGEPAKAEGEEEGKDGSEGEPAKAED